MRALALLLLAVPLTAVAADPQPAPAPAAKAPPIIVWQADPNSAAALYQPLPTLRFAPPIDGMPLFAKDPERYPMVVTPGKPLLFRMPVIQHGVIADAGVLRLPAPVSPVQ